MAEVAESETVAEAAEQKWQRENQELVCRCIKKERNDLVVKGKNDMSWILKEFREYCETKGLKTRETFYYGPSKPWERPGSSFIPAISIYTPTDFFTYKGPHPWGIAHYGEEWKWGGKTVELSKHPDFARSLETALARAALVAFEDFDSWSFSPQ